MLFFLYGVCIISRKRVEQVVGFPLDWGDFMLTRQVDSREKGLRPIPISYLIQTANQFDCEIYVTSEMTTANVKSYDDVKRLSLNGYLTFYFKGSDESEAKDRIQSILWE